MATNVSDVIDNAVLNKYHFRILVLCGLLILFDGFDLGAISFAAPEFVKLLGINRAVLGPVFSAGLFGLTLGALLFGFIGDRLGIKKTFVLCGIIYGIFSIITAFATSVSSLIIYRFIAGLGLGGATPLSIAFASTFCPKRSRAPVVTVMYLSFALGQITGGYTYVLLEHLGWRSIFYVGGTAPILLAPVIYFSMPETLEYMVMRGASAVKLRAILKRLAPRVNLENETNFTINKENKKGFQIAQLFQDGRAALTSILWVVFFTSIVAIYFYSTWLPTLLHGSGLSQANIIEITTSIQIGGAVGTVVGAYVVSKLGPFRTVSLGYLCAAVAMLVLGMGGSSFGFLFICSLAVGFFLVGTQAVLNVSAAAIYPPAMRSTGVGWGFGIGRIGGILSPNIVAVLLLLHWQPAQMFRVTALPTILACIFAFVLAQMLARQSVARGHVTAV